MLLARSAIKGHLIKASDGKIGTVSDLLFAQLPSLVRPILSALLLPTITSVRPTKPSPVTSQ